MTSIQIFHRKLRLEILPKSKWSERPHYLTFKTLSMKNVLKFQTKTELAMESNISLNFWPNKQQTHLECSWFITNVP